MSGSMDFLDAILSGNEEAMHYAVHLYEQAEKYGWRDLRNNPDDLPDNFHTVIICIKGCENKKIGINLAMHNRTRKIWATESFEYKDYEVIAWREIEPFEEYTE